jgi:hypothetical protein
MADPTDPNLTPQEKEALKGLKPEEILQLTKAAKDQREADAAQKANTPLEIWKRNQAAAAAAAAEAARKAAEEKARAAAAPNQIMADNDKLLAQAPGRQANIIHTPADPSQVRHYLGVPSDPMDIFGGGQ